MVLMAGSISATAPPTIQSPVSAQTTRKAIEKCISPNVSVFFMAFTSSGPNNNDSRLWLPMKRFISGLSFPLSLFVIVFVAGKWARLYIARHTAGEGRNTTSWGGIRGSCHALVGDRAQRALAMLHRVTKTLETAGVTYWLDHGTLLGIVREQRLLPWDTDMDITVPATSLPQLHAAMPALKDRKSVV